MGGLELAPLQCFHHYGGGTLLFSLCHNNPSTRSHTSGFLYHTPLIVAFTSQTFGALWHQNLGTERQGWSLV